MSRRTLVAGLLMLGAFVSLPGEDDSGPWRPVVQTHDQLVQLDGSIVLGTIIERTADGVRFQALGKNSIIGYTTAMFRELRPRRSAEDIIRHNLGLLRTASPGPNLRNDVAAMLRFGLESAATAAAFSETEAVVTHFPSQTGLAEDVIEVLQAAGGQDELIDRIIATVLTAAPTWRRGHTLRIQRARAAQRDADGDAAVMAALAQIPDHGLANLDRARREEAAGNLAIARDAYRLAAGKGEEEGWLGYATTSVLGGDFSAGLLAAQRLFDHPTLGDRAAAAAGIALAQQGKEGDALPLLERAVRAELPGRLGLTARHNLGVLRWRGGQVAEARQLWQGLDDPCSRLALAIAERRRPAEMPTHPQLAGIARELQTSLALSGNPPRLPPEDGNGPETARHLFLDKIRQIIATRGSPASVAALALTPGAESLRWQAYAHLLGGRLDDADTVLAKLPADDGWSQVVRVYVLSARGETEGARALYRSTIKPQLARLPASISKEFLSVMAAEFDLASERASSISFDWPDGEALANGWSSRAPGTGLTVHARQGRLVIDGTQSGSGPSRAWFTIKEDQLMHVVLDLEVQQGRGGIELLSADLQEGISLVTDAGGTWQWRQTLRGRPGPWQVLEGRSAAVRGLGLSYVGRGRVAVLHDPLQEPRGVGDRFNTAGHVAIGIVAEGEPGQPVLIRAKRLDILDK
jgi:hypothetical protein